MSPRTRAGGPVVLVTALVALVVAGPVGALAPAAGSPLPERPAAPTATATPAPTPTPTPAPPGHEHGHEAPAPTPAPSDEHGEHGTTPPDTVSDTTRTLVIAGFGALNGGVLAAAALVRRRRHHPLATDRPGPRR